MTKSIAVIAFHSRADAFTLEPTQRSWAVIGKMTLNYCRRICDLSPSSLACNDETAVKEGGGGVFANSVPPPAL